MLGPLAPRRDAGRDNYGCMSARELQGVKGVRGGGREELSAPGRVGQGRGLGKGQKWSESLIFKGDRVSVMSGVGGWGR